MSKHVIKVISLLLCLVTATACAPLFAAAADTAAVPSGAADWMAAIDDDTPLSAINIPGTHNSATKYCQMLFFTQCQSLDIARQLAVGFRYLDVRLGETDGGDLQLMHSFAVCRKSLLPWSQAIYMTDVVADCRSFLAAHPSETIIIAIRHEHGDMTTAEFETALDAILAQDPSLWLLTDRIPTLGEARGKIVLMRRYRDEAALGARSGMPAQWSDQGNKENTQLHIQENAFDNYALWVQDRYNYGVQDKWTAFTQGMANSRAGERDISVHFLSTSGSHTIGLPFLYAIPLNRRLLAMDDANIQGWVLVDFGSADIAAKIFQTNA